MASDLAKYRIRVNGINPGWINTAGERKLTPKSDMDKAAAFLPWGLGQPAGTYPPTLLPYPTLPYPTLSYPTLLYPTLPYPTLP